MKCPWSYGSDSAPGITAQELPLLLEYSRQTRSVGWKLVPAAFQ